MPVVYPLFPLTPGLTQIPAEDWSQPCVPSTQFISEGAADGASEGSSPRSVGVADGAAVGSAVANRLGVGSLVLTGRPDGACVGSNVGEEVATQLELSASEGMKPSRHAFFEDFIKDFCQSPY